MSANEVALKLTENFFENNDINYLKEKEFNNKSTLEMYKQVFSEFLDTAMVEGEKVSEKVNNMSDNNGNGVDLYKNY